MPGMYVMGSPSIPTNIEFKNNGGTSEFVLYAPQSHIEMKQNAEYVGLIAGKSVHLQENAIVSQPDGFELDPELTPWHTEEETPKRKGNPKPNRRPSSSRRSTTSSARVRQRLNRIPAAERPTPAAKGLCRS